MSSEWDSKIVFNIASLVTMPENENFFSYKTRKMFEQYFNDDDSWEWMRKQQTHTRISFNCDIVTLSRWALTQLSSKNYWIYSDWEWGKHKVVRRNWTLSEIINLSKANLIGLGSSLLAKLARSTSESLNVYHLSALKKTQPHFETTSKMTTTTKDI
jgi:hypothetical protein